MAPLYRLADRFRYKRHRNLGKFGEDIAHRFLRRQGYTIVARNWRPPQGGGEIDLVAWEAETLVFVEVKTRASNEWSTPEREINRDKIYALNRAARDYVRRSGCDPGHVRADVLAIDTQRTLEFQVRHYRDAYHISI